MSASRRVGPATTIAVAALVLSACTFSAGSGGHRPASGKPNIVFVLTDDLAWNLVQYMPHVLAMQKAGVTLSKYYVVDSLCCPSRSAILTGRYPHGDGVFTNGGSDGGYDTFNRNGNQPSTFAVALQKAGYRTALMGKYLNGYQPVDKPQPGWNEWDVAGNGYAEFNYKLNQNGSVHRYRKAPTDYLTDVLAGRAVSFVDKSAGAGKPFLLEVATFAPHKPSTPAPADATKFPGLIAPHAAAYNTTPSGAPAWLAAIPALTADDNRQIDGEYRRRVQSVQAVDRMIGRIEHELVAKNLAKNTYLVFSSDNGYHMGEHRLRPGKQTAFDTDINVPLMVTGPGVPAGRTVTALTSGIDLAPTFEAIAGAGIRATVDGAALLPLWHGQPPPGGWQQGILVEHHGPDRTARDPDQPGWASGDPPSYEALRTATALYVRYADGQREYYDTNTDPAELHNLAATAAPARLATLQQALSALQSCHGTASCQAAARLVG